MRPLSSDSHDADTVVAGTSPSWVSCVRCGVDNDPQRLLCGACGTALDGAQSEVAPIVDPGPSMFVSHDDVAHHSRGWWAAPLVVVAVGAAILAVLALLGLGPLAGDPAPAPVLEPPPGLAGADPRFLELSDVATLTTRGEDAGRDFVADGMVDGDPRTAWHADARERPDGTGEVIDLFLEQPGWVSAVVLDNGDHLDGGTYADNARVHRIVLRFDGGVGYRASLLDLGRAGQVVALPRPVLTTAVRMEIIDVFPGENREDPALSSVRLLGHRADGQDTDLAASRAESHPAAGPVAIPDP